jgi:hypothetical protein
LRECALVKDEDGIDLPEGDFRGRRRYLAPWLFALPGDDGVRTYPPPSDLVSEETWDGVMILPTDVALKTSSWEGSLICRLAALHSEWIFSWPTDGEAPFMEEAALLAGEEFDALVFNTLHGYYRHAIACLRTALEALIVSASLAVTNNQTLFDRWRKGQRQIRFGQARAWLRDSPTGKQIESDAAPASVFGNGATSWTTTRYARLCAYTHNQAGYQSVDFWESNGPIFVPAALRVVEKESRETLALAYLLLRLGWPGFRSDPGTSGILAGAKTGWEKYEALLRKWLISTP